MSLKDSINNDVSAIFLSLTEFAETIVYCFRAGGTRSISAIVDREPPAFYDAGGQVVTPQFTIEIHDDIDTGIRKNEINAGGDTVEIIEDNGDNAKKTVTVIQVIESDITGTIKLALR